MGADSAASLKKWKNYEAILDDYEVYVYPRIDDNLEAILKHKNLKIIKATQIELSATYIRQAIKAKKDVRFLLSEKVYNYVQEMHFYKK